MNRISVAALLVGAAALIATVGATAPAPAGPSVPVPHTQAFPHTWTVAELQVELRRDHIDLHKVLVGLASFLARDAASGGAANPAQQQFVYEQVRAALKAQHRRDGAAEQAELDTCNSALSSFVAAANAHIGQVHAQKQCIATANTTVMDALARLLAIERELAPLLARDTRATARLADVQAQLARLRAKVARLSTHSGHLVHTLDAAVVRHATRDTHLHAVNAAVDDAARIQSVRGPESLAAAQAHAGLAVTVTVAGAATAAAATGAPAAAQQPLPAGLSRAERKQLKEQRHQWRREQAKAARVIAQQRREERNAARAAAGLPPLAPLPARVVAAAGAPAVANGQAQAAADPTPEQIHARLSEEELKAAEARATLAAAIGPTFTAEFALSLAEVSAQMDEADATLTVPVGADGAPVRSLAHVLSSVQTQLNGFVGDKLRRWTARIRDLTQQQTALQAKLSAWKQTIRALKAERRALRAAKKQARADMKAAAAKLKAAHAALQTAQKDRYATEARCAEREAFHATHVQARALERETLRDLGRALRGGKPLATAEQIASRIAAAKAAADAPKQPPKRTPKQRTQKKAKKAVRRKRKCVKNDRRRSCRKGKRVYDAERQAERRRRRREREARLRAEAAADRAAGRDPVAAAARRREARKARKARRAARKAERRAAAAARKAERRAAAAKAAADRAAASASRREARKARKAARKAEKRAAAARKAQRRAAAAARKAERRAAARKAAAAKDKAKKAREARRRARKAARKHAKRAAAKRREERAKRRTDKQRREQARIAATREAQRKRRKAGPTPWKNHRCSDLGLPYCRFEKRPVAPRWCATHGRRCALDCFKNGRWQWTARTHCTRRGKKCTGTCCLGGWNLQKKTKRGRRGDRRCRRRVWPRPAKTPAAPADLATPAAPADPAAPQQPPMTNPPVDTTPEAPAPETPTAPAPIEGPMEPPATGAPAPAPSFVEEQADAEADAEAAAEFDAESEHDAPTCHTEGLDESTGVIYGPCMTETDALTEHGEY